ncbi:MAG: hypothetical protein CL728_03535 [Chloroflexi bacterium]|nr:hypothetical protein [Chloroflexota bacterium]
MKKGLLVALAFLLSIGSFAGGKGSCYDAYNKKFEDRGANEVEEGWHFDVVLTVRTSNPEETQCSYAKVKVEKGMITQIFLKNEDGTFQIFNAKWKYPEEKAMISNGMSKSRVTIDNRIVNVFFPKAIKPPKKKVAAAPSPDDL